MKRDYQITLRDASGEILIRLSASFLATLKGPAALDIGTESARVASIQVEQVKR